MAATWQVKTTDETQAALDRALSDYQAAGGYSTKGEALTALAPALVQAMGAGSDRPARVAAIDRLAGAIQAQALALASDAETAHDQAQAQVQAQLDGAAGRIAELESTLVETRAQLDAARADADAARADAEDARAQLSASQARLDAVLHLTSAGD